MTETPTPTESDDVGGHALKAHGIDRADEHDDASGHAFRRTNNRDEDSEDHDASGHAYRSMANRDENSKDDNAAAMPTAAWPTGTRTPRTTSPATPRGGTTDELPRLGGRHGPLRPADRRRAQP